MSVLDTNQTQSLRLRGSNGINCSCLGWRIPSLNNKIKKIDICDQCGMWFCFFECRVEGEDYTARDGNLKDLEGFRGVGVHSPAGTRVIPGKREDYNATILWIQHSSSSVPREYITRSSRVHYLEPKLPLGVSTGLIYTLCERVSRVSNKVWIVLLGWDDRSNTQILVVMCGMLVFIIVFDSSQCVHHRLKWTLPSRLP